MIYGEHKFDAYLVEQEDKSTKWVYLIDNKIVTHEEFLAKWDIQSIKKLSKQEDQ